MSQLRANPYDAYAENAAAIAMAMGRSPRWDEAYRAAAEGISGFPGMWFTASDAGSELTRQARRQKVNWDVTHDWIATVETLAEEILTFLIKNGRGFDPESDELSRLVSDALTEQ